MSDCPHSDVNWNIAQAEEDVQDEFVIPGVCVDCGKEVACRATIDDWWEQDQAL